MLKPYYPAVWARGKKDCSPLKVMHAGHGVWLAPAQKCVMLCYGFFPHKMFKHLVLLCRFSEAMMAGCIPVFMGPPFPPVPLLDELRYAAAAVFINITDRSGWEKDAQKVSVFSPVTLDTLLCPQMLLQ